MKTKLLAATIVLLATAQAIADVRMTERDDPVRVEIGGELYIGTEIAYKQGGYETGHVSRVARGWRTC